MVELRRTIKCSNCSVETTFYLSTEATIHELLLHGKCSRCGNSLQINYHLVEPGQTAASSLQSSSQSGQTQSVNLDDILFGGNSESNSLKDIIDG